MDEIGVSEDALCIPESFITKYITELIRPYVDSSAPSVRHGKHSVGEVLSILEKLISIGDVFYESIHRLLEKGGVNLRKYICTTFFPDIKNKKKEVELSYDYGRLVLYAIERQLPRITNILLDQPYANGMWRYGMYRTLAIHSHVNHNFMATFNVLMQYAPDVPWQDFINCCARYASTKNLEAILRKYTKHVTVNNLGALVTRCNHTKGITKHVFLIFDNIKDSMTNDERVRFVVFVSYICPSITMSLFHKCYPHDQQLLPHYIISLQK